MKRYYKHIKMFLLDQLSVIILFLLSPIVFAVFYLNISDITWLYYYFLSIFILLCYLAYKLYKTWNLYELFCNENKKIEEIFIYNPKCREEYHYKKLISQIYNCYSEKITHLEDEKKQNKLMIYRWVHQLKTPLSVIKLVAEKNKFEPDYKKILKSATLIQYDLDQVLNMYKLDSIKNDFQAQQINLRQIAKNNINELKSNFIEKNIFPKLYIDENLTVYSDYKWLSFVIYQLLTNAIKYSDNGKSVCIKAYNENKKIILSIEDEGCGITKEDIPRIFDLFFTGQNGQLYGESSGLGLYMVKQILDYLGHLIEVESDIKSGSKFKIIFN